MWIPRIFRKFVLVHSDQKYVLRGHSICSGRTLVISLGILPSDLKAKGSKDGALWLSSVHVNIGHAALLN